MLIDGAAYFTRLEAVLRQARRSVLILGWDFDGSIRLRPDTNAEVSPALGPLLRSLVEERPNLEIRILVWSIAVVHAPSDPKQLLLGAEWQDHSRLHLKLDTHHPLYASHHQKIVCVDDCIAFAGGIDLTLRRWDTSRHAVEDFARVSPDARRYDPVHDIQMAVDGDAARALADLARERWRLATGEALTPTRGTDLWPADLEPDFTTTPIAIARTAPAWGEQEPAQEAAALTADALAAARRTIYLEAQYFAAPYVGDILERRLSEPDGPEVMIVMTHKSRGVAERLVMGRNRDRLLRRLKRADHYGRLRAFYPCVPDRSGERHQVLVHSKLVIVDDIFIRVGSSNLNNRSVGLDTECDLAIEAATPAQRAAVAAIRDRLIAEHLDTTPETVARCAAEEGSLVRAVDVLNCRPRGLRLFEALRRPGAVAPVIGTRLLDPKRPFRPLRGLRSRLMRAAARQRGGEAAW